MTPWIVQLISLVYPVIQKAVENWQAANGTTTWPSAEQLNLQLQADAEKVLAEGDAWQAANPRDPLPPTPSDI